MTVLKTACFPQQFLLSPLSQAGGQREMELCPSLAHLEISPLGLTEAPGQAQNAPILWQSTSGPNCIADESEVTDFNYMFL